VTVELVAPRRDQIIKAYHSRVKEAFFRKLPRIKIFEKLIFTNKNAIIY